MGYALIVAAVLLCVWGEYIQYKQYRYRLKYTTSGGVLTYESYGSIVKYRLEKFLSRVVFVVAILLFIYASIILNSLLGLIVAGISIVVLAAFEMIFLD